MTYQAVSLNTVAFLDALRTLASASISGTYTAVGTPFLHPVRLICFTNNTDGDMIFTNDPTITAGQLFVAASSFKLFDVTSNRGRTSDLVTLPANQQWYVKQVTAPSKNAVYIEVVY